MRSLPAWERGLKLLFSFDGYTLNAVAPRVGAWIEILRILVKLKADNCRSPRGSVD